MSWITEHGSNARKAIAVQIALNEEGKNRASHFDSNNPDEYIIKESNGEISPVEENTAIETRATEIYNEWKEEQTTTQYQRDRASKYPSIQDVTVALAEKAEGDSTMWDDITAKRAKVKADHPKP